MTDEDVFRALRDAGDANERVSGYLDAAIGVGWFVDGHRAFRVRLLWQPPVGIRSGRTTDLDAPLAGIAEHYVVIPIRGNEVFGFAYWSGAALDMARCQRRAESLQNALDAAATFERLTEMAETDALTGLPNKGSYNREVAARIRHGRAVHITIVDLNSLKQINDEHGHDAGDAVIRNTAQAIEESLRKGDFACRWGGDEFALLTDSDPTAVVRRIEQRLETLGLVAAFGVATIPDDSSNLEQAFKAADQRMYEDKAAKKRARDPAGRPGPESARREQSRPVRSGPRT